MVSEGGGGRAVITLEEFVDRLVRLCADRGPRGFPRKTRDRQIVMKSVLLTLDSGRSYTEPEINQEIQRWKASLDPPEGSSTA